MTENKKRGQFFFVKGPRLQKKGSQFVIEEGLQKTLRGGGGRSSGRVEWEGDRFQ